MTSDRQTDRDAPDLVAQVIGVITHLMPFGVFLTDRDGRVLFANRVAREIAAERDGIRLSDDRLSVADARESRQLREALAGVIDAAGEAAPAIAVCNISRPSAQAPYRALMVGVRVALRSAPAARLGCIFVSDNQRSLRPEEPWLESFFGLTPTEAKVASLLAGGATLEEITEDLGIGMPTARTHLSRILDKTGASRQAELIRIILRSPTFLLPPGRGAGEARLGCAAKVE